MASGDHRFMVQGEHYKNKDIHLPVAYLRARQSQASPNDVCYERQLQSQDRRAHGMPNYSKSLLYSNKYNNAHVRCSIPEDKRELKRRLQEIQRHEAEVEVGRQKRVEQWRQFVVEEEREERERKREIEKLQKMIDREMQRVHHRYQTDVNSAVSSTHIPSNHADSIEVPRCSSVTSVYSGQEVVTDALQESSLIFEQPEDVNMSECESYAATPTDEQETCNIDVEDQLLPDRQDGAALKKCNSSKNTTEQSTVKTDSTEQTALSSVPTEVAIVPYDDAATIDIVELATTVEAQDAAIVLTEDDESKTDHYLEDSAADSDYAEHLHAVSLNEEASKSEQEWSRTESPVQDTVAALNPQPSTHKSAATSIVQLTTELQIQHTNVAVITHPEASEEFEATPTVQIITDITKIQQCHSKEVQTQDTTVSMAQPTATQHSESTIQFTTDSDTRSGPYDTKFWYHLCNTDGINKTPESMSTVFICCHSEYSCVILYLLLYS